MLVASSAAPGSTSRSATTTARRVPNPALVASADATTLYIAYPTVPATSTVSDQ